MKKIPREHCSQYPQFLFVENIVPGKKNIKLKKVNLFSSQIFEISLKLHEISSLVWSVATWMPVTGLTSKFKEICHIYYTLIVQ